MSALVGHAKATRILAEELLKQAEFLVTEKQPTEALIINTLACAHFRAAERIEQLMRNEAGA